MKIHSNRRQRKSSDDFRIAGSKIWSVQQLDYQTPVKERQRSWPFYLAFFVAYLPGLVILNTTDDILHMRATGNHNDGGVMFLSLYLSPLFAGAAAMIKAIWKRYETVGFAVVFAIVAPLLVYLLWVAIDII